MGAVVHRVNVRQQSVAQAQCLCRQATGFVTVTPRLFAHKFVVGRVQAHNRAEYAVLHPTGVQFIIIIAEHMPADIVAPPTVTDIRGGRGEIGLKL